MALFVGAVPRSSMPVPPRMIRPPWIEVLDGCLVGSGSWPEMRTGSRMGRSADVTTPAQAQPVTVRESS
jgi:hypothetical protein